MNFRSWGTRGNKVFCSIWFTSFEKAAFFFFGLNTFILVSWFIGKRSGRTAVFAFVAIFFVVFVLVAASCGQALASSPPTVGGQPMRIAGPGEAAKSARCIVAATPVKPVAPGIWEFSVQKWLRGSGAATVQIRGFTAPGFGGTSADAQAVPGRAVVALLSDCDGPTYSVMGPFVTPQGHWVPTGVYDARDFDRRVLE